MKKVVQVGVLIITSMIIVGCASSTAEEIEINEDKVPSVYSVIGEKKIVGTNSEIKNKDRITTLTYKAGSISEKEMKQYIDHLREEKYVDTLDSKDTVEGTMTQIGKKSVSDGNVVLIDFLYPAMDSEGVKITYRSGPGKLKENE